VSSGSIAAFEATLESVIVLAFFIPLLIGAGGNTGAQSATLVVRALATGDLRLRQWGRAVWKELAVGLVLGATMGAASGALGLLRGGVEVGIVVGLTMMSIVLVANLIGATLPFLLTRFGLDPLERNQEVMDQQWIHADSGRGQPATWMASCELKTRDKLTPRAGGGKFCFRCFRASPGTCNGFTVEPRQSGAAAGGSRMSAQSYHIYTKQTDARREVAEVGNPVSVGGSCDPERPDQGVLASEADAGEMRLYFNGQRVHRSASGAVWRADASPGPSGTACCRASTRSQGGTRRYMSSGLEPGGLG
jgi:hypothetical protein